MNRFLVACLAGAALGSSACAASVPMAPKALDADAKQFRLPPPDRANIYVYRDQWMGLALETFLGVDSHGTVATFGPRTYTVLTVGPGEHTLVSQVKEASTRLSVFVAGGTNLFVWQELLSDGGPAVRMHQLDDDSGARGVGKCELVALPPLLLPPARATKTGGQAKAAAAPVSPSESLIAIPAGGKFLAVFELQSNDLDEDVLMILSDEVLAGTVNGLRGHSGVNVMTRESIPAVIKDKGKGDCAEGDCEMATARNINADYVVYGNVVRTGQTYAITLKLNETRGRSLLATEDVEAPSQLGLKHALATKAQELVARAFSASPPRK